MKEGERSLAYENLDRDVCHLPSRSKAEEEEGPVC